MTPEAVAVTVGLAVSLPQRMQEEASLVHVHPQPGEWAINKAE